jgi:serine/threonine protein kinase
MRDVPGRRIAGKYELLERAGEGGMAVVWRAMTIGVGGFERPVAVKRTLPALAANPEFVQMFVEEARVGATLDHPNIVHIHDFAADEHGDLYLVMEWVEGLDLRRMAHAHAMEGQVFPWPIASAIMIEVLRGLHAAHTRATETGDVAPVFHRDVTPQNVLVSTKGTVKLTDFGLARAMDRAKVTSPGVVKGKLSYLAPELTRDAPPSVQTDVFGVGIVLWETLAGERLFDAPTDREVIEKVALASVPDIRELRPEVPPALADIVRTALSVDPAHRYRTAREMVTAIARVLRTLDGPVDGDVIAESVLKAREWAGIATGRRSVEDLEAERLRRTEAVRTALLAPPDLEGGSGAIPLLLDRKKQRPGTDR